MTDQSAGGFVVSAANTDAGTLQSTDAAAFRIVGSSAAAVTGLQFVVIALIADSKRRRGSHEIAAFGTPTILHFCTTLYVAAVISAPWHSLSSAAIALGAAGAAGLLYALNVIRRARRKTSYQLLGEDWIWYISLSVLAYAMLLGASICLPRHAEPALFVIGGAVLLLVYIGIQQRVGHGDLHRGESE